MFHGKSLCLKGKKQNESEFSEAKAAQKKKNETKKCLIEEERKS